MRWICAPLLAGMLVLLLAACEKNDLYRYQSFAFGTLIEIKIRHNEKSLADQVSAALMLDFDNMHRNWHAWEPGLLTEINQAFASGKSA